MVVAMASSTPPFHHPPSFSQSMPTPQKWPSPPFLSIPSQILVLSSSGWTKFRRGNGSVIVQACVADQKDDRFSPRRHMLVGVGVLATSFLAGIGNALAEKAPKGFQAVLDKFDGYRFLYPFGWQEVVVKGQDVVYKDVIEPLENVSVSIIDTDKTDVHQLGSAEEVSAALLRKVLASPSQKSQLLDAKEKVVDGKTYYTFEFLAKSSNYTRHALGTVAIANGRFFTLTTGANQRRWGKMEDRLRTVVDSFMLMN